MRKVATTQSEVASSVSQLFPRSSRAFVTDVGRVKREGFIGATVTAEHGDWRCSEPVSQLLVLRRETTAEAVIHGPPRTSTDSRGPYRSCLHWRQFSLNEDRPAAACLRIRRRKDGANGYLQPAVIGRELIRWRWASLAERRESHHGKIHPSRRIWVPRGPSTGATEPLI